MSEWKKRMRVVAIAAVSCLVVVELLSASEDTPRAAPAADGAAEGGEEAPRARNPCASTC